LVSCLYFDESHHFLGIHQLNVEIRYNNVSHREWDNSQIKNDFIQEMDDFLDDMGGYWIPVRK
jgi:hypothetical protein